MNYTEYKHWNKKIFKIDMKNEESKILSTLAWKWIKKLLKQNKKICIIAGKKWYSSGIICQDCWYIPKCQNCDIPIAFHIDQNGDFFGICHICKKHYNKFAKCPVCWWFNLNFYGTGTEKIQKLIKQDYWKESLLIESEKVNSPKKIERIKEKIKNYNIIVWTSLLNSQIKDIKFDLVIIINSDIGLNIPDFQSNYRNFVFIYETLKKHSSPVFIIQTFSPESYSIEKACKMDLQWFKKQEEMYRKDFWYPPFKEITKILYKHEIEKNVFKKIDQLYQELLFLLEKYWLEDIQIYPTPPLIYKIFWKYRYNIILKWNNLRDFLDTVYSKLNLQKRWFKIDRNPENIVQ